MKIFASETAPRDGLLRREAVQNLQTWILTSGLRTNFSPLVLQDQFRSIMIFAWETAPVTGFSGGKLYRIRRRRFLRQV
jgi:hypothetical protein